MHTSIAKTQEPRSFVKPPFIQCPTCGKKAYGIWYIDIGDYIRLCTECPMPNRDKGEMPEMIPLPSAQKKIVYLDQNVISGIAKAFDPTLQRTRMEPHVQKRWIDLFHKLDRLRRKQVLICPSSVFHRRESFVNEQLYKPLMAVYKRLSNFIEFNEAFDIQSIQIIQLAKHQIDDSEPAFIDNPQLVVNGKINSWENISIKALFADYEWKSEYGEKMREQDVESHREFQTIYDRWKPEGKSIEEKIEEESRDFGTSVREMYTLFLMKKGLEQSCMPPPPDLVERLNEFWDEHPYIHLVHKVHDVLASSAISTPHTIRQAIDFVAGDMVRKEAPAIHIEPLLWSALARQAAATEKRKEKIDPGDLNDIATIATFLPYCDAIFVDNAWHGRLKENPTASEISKYHTKIFSSRNIDEFMQFLDEIETQAPQHILDTVTEVYGDDLNDENPLEDLSMYE